MRFTDLQCAYNPSPDTKVSPSVTLNLLFSRAPCLDLGSGTCGHVLNLMVLDLVL